MIMRKIWQEVFRPVRRMLAAEADLAVSRAVEKFNAQALRDLRADERFNRQALHDIASILFGGPETFDHAGQDAVGLVIPTCDRPQSLRRALASVAAQSRRPDKVIVVNDGQERIENIVGEFSGRLAISILRTEHPYSGPSVARNLALDMLDTPLLAFLDDDNLMWPRWMERAAAFLESDPKIDIIYGVQLRDAEFSKTTKNWFLVPFDFEELKQGNYIDLNQLMHRRSATRFDPALKRLIDWDYVLRLIDSRPDRIVPVDAISSLYLASGFDRISVALWPPDLGSGIAEREGAAGAPLPVGACVCSCCNFTGKFLPGPDGRPSAGCPQCGSLERHRFLQLMGPLLRGRWVPETRPFERTALVEVAPSSATLPFRRLFGNSKTVDADPQADGRVVDIVASLTDLPFPGDYADVLLALHVLEHIPDDRKAMAEIARVLAPTGVAVLQVPLSDRDTTDEAVLDTPEERVARYGQADHVRLYGNDFFARLNEAGLTCAAVSPRESMSSGSMERYGLLPDQALVFAVRFDAPRAKECLEYFFSSLTRQT